MTFRRPALLIAVALLVGGASAAALWSGGALSAPPNAQDGQKRGDTVRKRALDTLPQPGSKRQAPQASTSEKVEADVSTRTIAVTSGFTGTEIIVFGAVDNSRQEAAEAGYYDVVVAIEGASTPLAVRKKSNIAGIWTNTDMATFEGVPSYYAIASTRPVEEIADERILEQNAIGLPFVRMAPAAKTAVSLAPEALKGYKDAIVRLKQREGLFVKSDYAVAFIGRSLFRSSIALPANVPVGQLSARVYLFRQGEIISTYSTRVKLEREGVERLLHRFATRHPLWYGLFTVAVAMIAGLLGFWLFPRKMA